ncbi:MAG: hypothetical protein HY875_10835 [Chloroflexi bacterium]|nr:hypothetical protein [Chloroflexota bacterium]
MTTAMPEPPFDQCCEIAPENQACALRRPAAESNCPGCGKRLRPVPASHVMHHVRAPATRGIERAPDFGFCPSPGCSVVYVSAGRERFDAGDLRSPPAYKTREPGDLLCFCFDVSGADALSPLADATVAFISDRVRAGDCACDVLNPSGGCCLGSIGTYRKARGSPHS